MHYGLRSDSELFLTDQCVVKLTYEINCEALFEKNAFVLNSSNCTLIKLNPMKQIMSFILHCPVFWREFKFSYI